MLDRRAERTRIFRRLRAAVIAAVGMALALAPALAMDGAADTAPGFAGASRTCPAGNLVQGAPVTGQGLEGDPRTAADGLRVREGWPVEAPQAVRLRDANAWIAADLGAPYTIAAVELQADGTDAFVLEGSADGWTWAALWRPGPVAAPGLRSRTARIDPPGTARYLRVSKAGGSGSGAVSELRARCSDAPEAGAGSGYYAPAPARRLTRDGLDWARLAIAAAALLLFLWGLVLRRAGRPDQDVRLRDGVLAALALLSAACYFNLGRFHFDHFVHPWDQFHYFVGSKYAPELGHDGLYACATAVDLEDGRIADVATRKIRDLTTNRLIRSDAIVAAAQGCRGRFAPERWTAFRADVAWFREAMPAYEWSMVFRDHGYNASPMWEALGGVLSNRLAAGPGTLAVLGAIDVALLLGLWVAVAISFGWRAAAAGVIWWGTNAVAEFMWTGGGFLRQDWLFLSGIGICFMRRGRPALAGAALTWAALLRIFPAFLVVGLALKAVVAMVRRRSLRPDPAHARFALGCVLALGVLVPLSFTARGPGAWLEFVENSRTHLSTPGTNTVGLGVVAAWDATTRMELMRDPTLDDPDGAWKDARRDTGGRHRLAAGLVLVAYLALLGAAAARQPDWAALVLGVGLIPFATVQSSYYYAVFLLFGTLWVLRREVHGALLAGLAVWTCAAGRVWTAGVEFDERFHAVTLGVLVFVVAATVLSLRAAPATGE